MMIKTLINKLILSKRKEIKFLLFDDDELEYIYNLSPHFIIDSTEKEEVIKFFYLICNINTNIDEKFINFAKKVLSIINMYFTDSEIQNDELFGIKISNLVNNLEKINNKTLTVEQDKILKLFRENNVCLKATTGTGKSFISSYFLVERYMQNNDKNIEKKFIFIVPTEILEWQIIKDLKSCYKELSENNVIGNSIIENDILIITCEKLLSYINAKTVDVTIDTLIIDEAHMLFDKNDARSQFLNHTITQYLSKKSLSKIILLSPFSFLDNLRHLKKLFSFEEFNFVNIEFSKQNIYNKLNLNEYDPEKFKDNSEQFDELIFDNTNSIVCVYTNTKNNAKKIANKWYKNHDYTKNLLSQQKKEIDKEELKNIQKELESKDYDVFKKYLNFQYLKKGICYLTSDVPHPIKSKIIELVNKRYIRLVVATSLIIAGIDLPFDMTLMDSHKVNNKILDNNSIVNFFGRAGRINNYKKAYGMGISYIKISNRNTYNWWLENKEDILSKLKHLNIDSKNVLSAKSKNNFIDKSYKEYKNTNDISYILDPRINPKTTFNLKSKATNESYLFLLRKFLNIFINRSDLEVLAFLYIYNFMEYSSTKNQNIKLMDIDWSLSFEEIFYSVQRKLVEFKNWQDEKYKYIYMTKKYRDQKFSNWVGINNTLNWYITKEFSTPKSLKIYLQWINKSYASKKTSRELTEYIEEFVEINKDHGRFQFLIFLNHFWMLIDNPKYTNISIILDYHIINYAFYKFLRDKNYIKRIKELTKDKKTLLAWKRINNLNNDLIEIYNELKSLDDEDNKIYSKLIKNTNFLDDLEEYIYE